VESSLVLSELLTPEQVRVPLRSHSKAALLRELVRLAVRDASEETIDGVLAAVLARESKVSTAMGGGLAVPHGRTDLLSDVRVSAGLVEGAEDYGAPDGSPVRVAFLVLTPPHGSATHLKLLGRIARVMHGRESRRALLAAPTAEEFLAVIRHSEEEHRVMAS
jgi:mannitol/fructose-specific phosphotransferase system IIA component (Ntr-type)